MVHPQNLSQSDVQKQPEVQKPAQNVTNQVLQTRLATGTLPPGYKPPVDVTGLKFTEIP